MNIKKNVLLSMYEMLIKIRLFEEKLIELHPEQDMKCLQHYCIGQEAITVGINAHLNNKDKIFCSFRSHGHYLAKGGKLKPIFSELYLKSNGLMRGRGGSMHLSDLSIGLSGSFVIVGSYVPIAVGTALSIKIKKENNVVVVFFGDGAIDEGVIYEAFNFAALKSLPIIFVCENNGIASMSKDEERQAQLNHNLKSEAFGVPAISVDGQNVIEVYNSFSKAMNRAKKGKGPTFINAKTFRFKAHIGVGDDIGPGLRTKKELDKQKKKDPIELFKKKLIKLKIIDEQKEAQIINQINKKLESAVNHAKASPLGNIDDLIEDVYA